MAWATHWLGVAGSGSRNHRDVEVEVSRGDEGPRSWGLGGVWLEPGDEGKKGNEVPEPRITKPNKDEVRAMKLEAAKKVPKPKKAAPKKDKKKTKKTPVDLMRGRQEAKKNKKHKAVMNPKDK